MIYTRQQLPKYCLHRASGRAYVRIGGKMYYLGRHDSAASRREYDRIIAEFIANGRQSLYSVDELVVPSNTVIFLFLHIAYTFSKTRPNAYHDGRIKIECVVFVSFPFVSRAKQNS